MTLPYEPPHDLARVLRSSRVIAINGADGLRGSFVKTPLLAFVAVVGGAVLEPLLCSHVQSG